MLTYVDKGKGITIFRQPAPDSKEKALRLGIIDRRNFAVRVMPDANATTEEMSEIEAYASGLSTADEERKAAVLEFPSSARKAVEFYGSKATNIDKQVIGFSVQHAARAIRKQTPPATDEEKRTKPAVKAGLPSPEAVAGALYSILSQNVSGKVLGQPSAGKRTRIFGSCDLTAVARALLALS